MAALVIIIIGAVNTWLTLSLSGLLGFQPEIWWWKIVSQLIWVALTIGVSAIVYFIFHYAMSLKPVRYLVKFTSLTSLPFWRRYVFLKGKKYKIDSQTKSNPEGHEIV
jgi:hypothetical protein